MVWKRCMSQIWFVWEVGRRDSTSPKVELGEFYEDGLRLGELDEQLGKSYEDCLVLDELFFELGELHELLLCMKGLSARSPTLRVFTKD